MAETTGEDMTIDALARQAQLPVRTIREYHTMRLLPPPERRGRVGFYGRAHVQRLELIGRLQRRGYSLAGIRDLLRAWQDGNNLTSLLGVEPGQALDETPLRLTRAELEQRAPALFGPVVSGAALSDAASAGLIHQDGDGFLVRSPAMLAFVADGVAAGLPLPDLLELAAAVRRHLAALSEAIADIIVDRLLPRRSADHGQADLASLLQRARMLLLQAAASILADQLGGALLKRSADAEGGAALRAAIEQIRVGAVADTAGNIRTAR